MSFSLQIKLDDMFYTLVNSVEFNDNVDEKVGRKLFVPMDR